MNLTDLLKNRKSCRKYASVVVTSEIVDSVLWAGSRAPYASGGPRRVIYSYVSQEDKKHMQECCHMQKYVGDCSVVFLVCGVESDIFLSSGNPKYIYDCAASVMCMDLCAREHGLSTCWIGHFSSDGVSSNFDIKGTPTMILISGYPEI